MKSGLKKHEETMMKLLVEQEGIQKQIFSILNVKYWWCIFVNIRIYLVNRMKEFIGIEY